MDASEAARYLNWPEGAIDDASLAQIEEIGALMAQSVTPRTVYRVLDRTREGCAGLALPGEDIRALMRDAEQVIVFACTLGEAGSRFIRRAFAKDTALGVIADACASAMADGEADRFEREMTGICLARGRYLTDRFSPGYGDLPLTVQRDLCALLDTPRTLGVTVNGSMLLVPEKSVTAVMGICPVPQRHRAIDETTGCEGCAARDGCGFRRRGRTCHG